MPMSIDELMRLEPPATLVQLLSMLLRVVGFKMFMRALHDSYLGSANIDARYRSHINAVQIERMWERMTNEPRRNSYSPMTVEERRILVDLVSRLYDASNSTAEQGATPPSVGNGPSEPTYRMSDTVRVVEEEPIFHAYEGTPADGLDH